jgi:hypothetical protein
MLWASVLWGQKFEGGLFGGMSTSQIMGDNLSGYDLAGFNGGFFTYVDLTPKSSLQLEISFVQKGSQDPPSDTSTFYKARLNYVVVPLLYRYRLDKLGFEIGPTLDILVNSQESDISGNFQSIPPFNTYSLSAILAVNYHFNSQWWVSFRGNNSLSLIRPFRGSSPNLRYLESGQRNFVLTFGVYYSFFNGGS